VTTFGDRLNQLFATVHPRGRGPHTLQEVADAINAEGVAKISPSYLSQLRSGQKDNPSSRAIDALARFFKVRPDFFFDTEYARQMERDLETLVRLRDAGVEKIASRSFDLSAENMAALETMVEALRASQGLPPEQSGLSQGGEDQARDE
jgi:transcriptional regulator with XRE-family HTH domain